MRAFVAFSRLDHRTCQVLNYITLMQTFSMTRNVCNGSEADLLGEQLVLEEQLVASRQRSKG